jgi:hypothetical protein
MDGWMHGWMDGLFLRSFVRYRYVLDELQRCENETERLTLELEAARSRVRTLESQAIASDKARHVAETELAELLSKKDEVTDLRRMVDTLRMHGGSGGGALLQPSPHTSYYRGGDANDGGGATARVFHRRSSPLR